MIRNSRAMAKKTEPVKYERTNLASVWTMLSGVVLVVAYMFNTFATAADVEEIKYTLLKMEIRNIRKDIKGETNTELRDYLKADLEDIIDSLCRIAPTDRECRTIRPRRED